MPNEIIRKKRAPKNRAEKSSPKLAEQPPKQSGDERLLKRGQDSESVTPDTGPSGRPKD